MEGVYWIIMRSHRL